MEPRFGPDFSRIRLFSGAPVVVDHAHRLTMKLTAKAPIFDDNAAPEEKPTNEEAATKFKSPVGETPLETRQPEGATSKPKEGETLRLPNIDPQNGPTFTIAQADPVNPTLYYTPQIAQVTASSTCPVDTDRLPKFGLTNCPPPSINTIDITPLLGWYYVDANLDERITYQVCDGVGPQGQVDITSENDPNLTKQNYVEVAQNLSPDSKGVPPRRLYYSSDLTLRHERFHASEWVKIARDSLPQAQKWLMGKTASTPLEISFLLTDLGKQFMKTVGDKMRPGAEDRAYADGAPLYRARVNAIIAKGHAGGYPEWDWRKGMP
jgi:hypothetical protein